MDAAQIITVAIESTESGLYSATSEDVPGFFVAATSAAQMSLAIPAALEDFFRARKNDVIAFPVHSHDARLQPWAILPRALIAKGDERAALHGRS